MRTRDEGLVTEEIWKPIPGFNGWYDVSDRGRVRTWKAPGRYGGRRETPLIRKTQPFRSTPGGHLGVLLHINGVPVNRSIHSLVMLAFVGPRPEGMEICHNDGDPTNNNVSNLRYDTPAANSADMKLHGTVAYGMRNGAARLDDRTVLEIRSKYRHGSKQADLMRFYGISRASVCRIVNHKAWTHLKEVA